LNKLKNMFNSFLFNTKPFNYIATSNVFIIIQDDITYNEYWLQNSNIITSVVDFDNWHFISSEIYSNPLNDLWWELNYFFKEKVISLTWVIKMNNAEDLNNKIDELKKILWQNNKNIDIKVNWTIRRAKASCINIDSLFNRQHYNITWLDFNIKFRLVSWFLTELTKQNQSFVWLTSWITEEITNRWSVKTNPEINILLNSISWTNILVFSIWEREITINYTFINWDNIKIDCKEKIVTINWINVDYLWIFPILEVWINSYTINLNWIFDFNITLSYFNNYL